MKTSIASRKGKFFSSSWVLEWFFLFWFWLNVFFTSYVACYVISWCRKMFKRRSTQIFFKTGVLKNFAIFTGKHLCWSLFPIKFQDWRFAYLYKKRHQDRCFSVNIAKFLRTAFFIEDLFIILFWNFIWWKVFDILE